MASDAATQSSQERVLPNPPEEPRWPAPAIGIPGVDPDDLSDRRQRSPGPCWFLAFDQSFEAASLHLYAVYQHFNPDIDLVTRDLSVSPDGKLRPVGESLDDFDVFYTGSRMYF